MVYINIIFTGSCRCCFILFAIARPIGISRPNLMTFLVRLMLVLIYSNLSIIFSINLDFMILFLSLRIERRRVSPYYMSLANFSLP